MGGESSAAIGGSSAVLPYLNGIGVYRVVLQDETSLTRMRYFTRSEDAGACDCFAS